MLTHPAATLHYIGKANSGSRWRWVGNMEETGGEPKPAREGQERLLQPTSKAHSTPLGHATTTDTQGEGAEDRHKKEFMMTIDTGNTRGRDKFVPHQEPTEAHPQQFRPNRAKYTLATTLFKRDPEEWKIDDIKTPYLSDGMAVLNSAFVDHAATTLRNAMTLAQRYQLAQQVAVTAPETI